MRSKKKVSRNKSDKMKTNPSAMASVKHFCKVKVKTNPSAAASAKHFCKVCKNNPSVKTSLMQSSCFKLVQMLQTNLI